MSKQGVLNWQSSTVQDTVYHPPTKILTVTFKNGTTYEYKEVPLETWKELQATESIGKFLAGKITGKFEFKKLPNQSPL